MHSARRADGGAPVTTWDPPHRLVIRVESPDGTFNALDYAIEARVPMNPRTGTYSRNWRRGEYGPEWILERFPAERNQFLRASGERPPET